MPFRLGRLPEDRSKPRLTLAPHLRAAGAPPASADWYSHVQAWGVLGNSDWGDCVFAGNGHIIEQQTALGEGAETPVADQDVLAEYSRVAGFDPNAGPPGSNPTDRGALIQDGLADLRATGLAGRKIAAYARVNEADETEMRTALAELGCLALGVNMPQSAMDQFDAGQPWTVVPDDGGILGGHCVTAFGYDTDFMYVVSWGKVVPVAWDWLRAYTEEAWAVVSAMWAGENGHDPEGVDLQGLGEEFAALTGEASPFPAPAPAPPGPAAGPASLLSELASLIREVAAAADRDIAEVIAWLRQHAL